MSGIRFDDHEYGMCRRMRYSRAYSMAGAVRHVPVRLRKVS